MLSRICLSIGLHFRPSVDTLILNVRGLTSHCCLVLVAGFVFLYHIPLLTDWDSLTLEHPDRTLQFGTEHVHAIAIGDNGVTPFVAVATNDYCINLVKFSRKRKKSVEHV